jgi:uncharacterized protein YbaA (DUF1428 family)
LAAGSALVALALPAAALAQTAPSQSAVDPMARDAAILAPAGDTAQQVAFAYADRNEDAVVSWEEYRNRAMRMFHHVDTNDDDILEIAEIRQMSGPDAPAAPFDISADLFNAALRKAFDAGDRNGDGALTPAEWHDTVRPSRLF